MSTVPDEASFYRRQVVLPEIGAAGQARLKAARVLVIGAGGLGSPLLMYLVGAGVGTLGFADFDCVEPSNLHRQILHGIDRLDMPKVQSAALTLARINPHVRLVEHAVPVNAENADALVAQYDVVADGCDNFATRDAVHAACRRARIVLVSAAVQLADGILTTFKSHLGGPHPCFRCLYPEVPALAPSCSEIGVLGPAVGVMGALQAIEVIKEILGVEPSLSGTLAMYDAWSCDVTKVELPRRENCPCCGAAQEGNAGQPPVTGGNRTTSSVAVSGCDFST
ncbi:HesA/MoeB/ThiF family protein [Nitrospirillum amazonense]|uniref:HesA/MoeB/ThiF family protein n=1 Tax=Nitrospirillum amazonense TaxID=28077 RepID=UPI00241242F6|nr:HesA/MoeB/ThiF family protein [Nitrospirillum amazonense]MDG3439001.1 HesA/MoeB/ThiF family protein [Nitrospirillum amazonense]